MSRLRFFVFAYRVAGLDIGFYTNNAATNEICVLSLEVARQAGFARANLVAHYCANTRSLLKKSGQEGKKKRRKRESRTVRARITLRRHVWLRWAIIFSVGHGRHLVQVVRTRTYPCTMGPQHAPEHCLRPGAMGTISTHARSILGGPLALTYQHGLECTHTHTRAHTHSHTHAREQVISYSDLTASRILLCYCHLPVSTLR